MLKLLLTIPMPVGKNAALWQNMKAVLSPYSPFYGVLALQRVLGAFGVQAKAVPVFAHQKKKPAGAVATVDLPSIPRQGSSNRFSPVPPFIKKPRPIRGKGEATVFSTHGHPKRDVFNRCEVSATTLQSIHSMHVKRKFKTLFQ